MTTTDKALKLPNNSKDVTHKTGMIGIVPASRYKRDHVIAVDVGGGARMLLPTDVEWHLRYGEWRSKP